MSQYDSGRQYTAYLKDETNTAFIPGTGATAKIKGFNAAGVAWEQEATVDGSTVVFTPSGAATDQFGVMPVTIEITYDGETLTPLLMVFDIQRAGYTNEEAARSPEFAEAMEEAAAEAVGDAVVWRANQAAKTDAMTNPIGIDEGGKLWAEPGPGGSSNAVQYVAQSLTTSQKAQARTNIGAYNKPSTGIPWSDLSNDLMTSIGKAENAVRFNSQSLTSAQQEQARTNINAAANPSTVTISDSVVIISEAQDNTEYICVSQLLTSVTISAIASDATAFVLYFESQPGTTPVALTVPSNVIFPPGFQMDVSTFYEMSFVKRGSNWLVAVGAWDITT